LSSEVCQQIETVIKFWRLLLSQCRILPEVEV